MNVRLKAVQLLGQLFALPGRQFAQEYPPLFSEFLKRFSDKVVEVRLAVVNSAKGYLEANPTGEQATLIFGEFQTSSPDRILIYQVKTGWDLVQNFV